MSCSFSGLLSTLLTSVVLISVFWPNGARTSVRIASPARIQMLEFGTGLRFSVDGTRIGHEESLQESRMRVIRPLLSTLLVKNPPLKNRNDFYRREQRKQRFNRLCRKTSPVHPACEVRNEMFPTLSFSVPSLSTCKFTSPPHPQASDPSLPRRKRASRWRLTRNRASPAKFCDLTGHRRKKNKCFVRPRFRYWSSKYTDRSFFFRAFPRLPIHPSSPS